MRQTVSTQPAIGVTSISVFKHYFNVWTICSSRRRSVDSS